MGLIVSIDRGRVELTLSYRSTLNPIIAIVSPRVNFVENLEFILRSIGILRYWCVFERL